MAIWKTKTGFKLDTRNTSYLMETKEKYLLHTYYGAYISDESAQDVICTHYYNFNSYPGYDWSSPSFALNSLPWEYGTCGVADYRVPPIRVRQADGSTVIDPHYEGAELFDGIPDLEGLPFPYADDGERVQTLEVTLVDPATQIAVILGYTVFEQKDVIVRYTKVENRSQATVTLEKVHSLQMDFNRNNYDFIHLYGDWAKERQIERIPLHQGSQGFSSRRGSTGHGNAPFFALCDHDATETSGDAYGFHLMYSGCHQTEIETDLHGTTRCVMGIHADHFAWKLEPGAAFTTPAALLTFSDHGIGEMSRRFHTFIRDNICPKQWRTAKRPILINNWEATYFNFNEEKLLGIAKRASELGIEMLVMDDGWFGHRTDDHSSLGDWYEDRSRLPLGVPHLAQEVEKLGMKFGIWMEPEMISPDSDLYRAHPDYAIHIPGRVGSLGRHQLVLDFSRKEVVDCIYEMMEKILSTAPISYLKWDMNRSLTEMFSISLPADRQGEFAHRYVLGVYDLMHRVVTRFPRLLLENCSGGGGRFDTGMLRYSPQIWTSDDTDASERVKIQYGTSIAFPVSCMGAHVSACPNHQTNRTTSFDTRAKIAMNGTFGYELDVNKLSQAEQDAIPAQCAFYRTHAELINRGDLHRLQTPFGTSEFGAWAYVSQDKKEILLFAYRCLGHSEPTDLYVKLPADPALRYECDGVKVCGDTLSKAGVRLVFGSGDHLALCRYYKAK